MNNILTETCEEERHGAGSISNVVRDRQIEEAQKVEAGEVLAGRPAGEASLAAVETGVGKDRTCPHCAALAPA